MQSSVAAVSMHLCMLHGTGWCMVFHPIFSPAPHFHAQVCWCASAVPNLLLPEHTCHSAGENTAILSHPFVISCFISRSALLCSSSMRLSPPYCCFPPPSFSLLFSTTHSFHPCLCPQDNLFFSLFHFSRPYILLLSSHLIFGLFVSYCICWHRIFRFFSLSHLILNGNCHRGDWWADFGEERRSERRQERVQECRSEKKNREENEEGCWERTPGSITWR